MLMNLNKTYEFNPDTDLLGTGGFGKVYKAVDKNLGMVVALKKYSGSLPAKYSLFEEIKRAIKLNHPNLVRYFDAFELQESATFGDTIQVGVLEYVNGGDLSKLLRKQPDLPTLTGVLVGIMHGLRYLHSKGIIHRDLKPNNFLLSADKRTLKVADFGVAKITSGESTEITRVGADVYAPPEHNPNENTGDLQQLTTAADVYSLAKSFYTVICGRAPSQFRCDQITSLPEKLAGKPWGAALLKVLCQATDDNPKARYATVAEFWHQLAQVAALNPTVKIEDLPDEETIVKPRQKFDTGAFPKTPAQPDFDPTPATSQLQATVSSALPVQTEALPVETEALPTVAVAEKATEPIAEPAIAENLSAQPKIETLPSRNDRPGKIFIELQPQKVTPIPPMPAPAAKAPVATKPSQAKPPSKSNAKQPPKVASRFSENARRRVFFGFLVIALIGLFASVFNIFSKGELGTPNEVEVVPISLNVREAPGKRPIGTVAQGTRHRVLSVSDQGWMLIQVGQWETLKTGTPLDANQGWVDGNPEFVRVVSRRWW